MAYRISFESGACLAGCICLWVSGPERGERLFDEG
jgi:hypothetical protein